MSSSRTGVFEPVKQTGSRKTSWRLAQLGLLATSLLAVPLTGLVTPAVAGEAKISSTPSQTIKGWGFFPYPRHESLLKSPKIADAVYDLKPDFIRLAIDKLFNDNGTIDSGEAGKLAAHIRMAKSRGVDRYIVTTWTPPIDFKKYHSDKGRVDGAQNSLLSGNEDRFVASYINALRALEERGAGLPVAISIQNELDWSPSWSGNQYSGDQWRRVVKKMRAGLDRAGLSRVAIHGPEAGGYLSAVAGASYLGSGGFRELEDSALNRAVGAYAYHSYNRCEVGDNVRGIQRFPKDVWMTEWSIPGGSNELDWSIRDMQHLMSDLVALKFNYWSWWWASSPWRSHDGESLVFGTSNPNFTKPYYVFKKLWGVVDPGWRVHRMSTNESRLKAGTSGDCASNVDMLAFENSKRTASAVLLTNPTGSSIGMRVSGLKGKTVEVSRTTANEDMKSQGSGSIQGGAYTVTLPAKSVVLMSSAGGTETPPPSQAGTIRINSGSTQSYTAPTGDVFGSDKGFVGGQATDRGSISIDDTKADGLFRTERYGMRGYSIPVPNGTYEVHLHFAETYSGITAPGQRIFGVKVEGKSLGSIDVFKEAGGRNRALEKIVTVPVRDGKLTIGFTAQKQQPIINAIGVFRQ